MVKEMKVRNKSNKLYISAQFFRTEWTHGHLGICLLEYKYTAQFVQFNRYIKVSLK